MRFFGALALAATAVIVVAKPHHYPHHHAHAVANHEVKHDRAVDVPAPVETVIVYVLNGHLISEAEVNQGIGNGTLEFAEDGTLTSSAIQPSVTPTLAALQSEAQAPGEKPDSLEEPVDDQPHQPAEAPSKPEQPTQPESPPPKGSNGECADCDKEFPNGTLPCSEFPMGYGAVPLDHEGLGGFSGIQHANYNGPDGYDDIETRPTGSCKDGPCCTPGSFCSYACPNPYLKMSFPKKQGKTKQSVGGLYCNSNGMLEMADGSIATTLCGKGTNKFTVKVENRLSEPVSICRTDYPGTESETIPLTLQPGETGELANPQQSKYFFWDDKPTSAHYYINKKGVPESEACSWGTGEQAVGNWAPTILGTSFDDINMSVGFPSLYQNLPTSHERLDFSISFTGDGIADPCSYKHTNGEYYKNGISMGDTGCTASAKEGATLTVIFSE